MKTKLAAVTASALAVGVGLLVSACATVPTGPGVMVLPGAGKSFEQFQADDAVCRQWAMERTGTTTQQAATQSAVSSAAIGTAVGAAAGAAIGAAAGSPAIGAAVGAGTGLFGGTAIGTGYAESAHLTVQRRYDIAYVQCMYAKGNQVPVPGSVARSSSYAQPPAPPPPANVPSPPANVPPPPPGPPPPPPPNAPR